MIKKPRKNRTKTMQFTIKQHYLGAQFIKKFSDESGNVEVVEKKTKKIITKSAKDQIFYTKKCWDERTEQGMKKIEDDFAKEINKAVNGSTDLDSKIINTYYWMWNIRGRLSDRRIQSPTFNVQGENLSFLEQDNLEKNGAIFIKEDGKMHDDMHRGVVYQIELTKLLSLANPLKSWGVLESPDKELICCDFFDYDPFANTASKFIVISPNMLLMEDSEHGVITRDSAEKINKFSMELSRKYCIRKKVTA